MSASRPSRASSTVSKVVVLDLVEERQFTTKANDTFVYYLVSRDAELEELGPWLETIQIAAELINPSAGFIYKVIGRKSVRGQGWEDFAGDLLSEQVASSAGKAILGTPYATATDLGAPRIAVLVGIRNTTNDTTTFQNGVLSVRVTLVFKT